MGDLMAYVGAPSPPKCCCSEWDLRLGLLQKVVCSLLGLVLCVGNVVASLRLDDALVMGIPFLQYGVH